MLDGLGTNIACNAKDTTIEDIFVGSVDLQGWRTLAEWGHRLHIRDTWAC